MVTFASFRASAFSLSKEEARASIGDEIGRDGQTLKDWEKRLKISSLGALEVHREIAFALNAASHVRHALKATQAGKTVSTEEQALADRHQHRYGPEALAVAISDGKRAEGAAGAN